MDRTINWSQVTKDVKGRTITTPVTYNLYRNGTLVGPSNDLHEPISVPDDSGEYAYQVTAIANGIESVKSVPVTLDSFVAVAPEAPQGVRITVTVTVGTASLPKATASKPKKATKSRK